MYTFRPLSFSPQCHTYDSSPFPALKALHAIETAWLVISSLGISTYVPFFIHFIVSRKSMRHTSELFFSFSVWNIIPIRLLSPLFAIEKHAYEAFFLGDYVLKECILSLKNF